MIETELFMQKAAALLSRDGSLKKSSHAALEKLYRRVLKEVSLQDIDPEGVFYAKQLRSGKKRLLQALSRRPFKVPSSSQKDPEDLSETGPEWVWFGREYLQIYLEEPISRSFVKAALSRIPNAYQEFNSLVRRFPPVRGITDALNASPLPAGTFRRFTEDRAKELFIELQKQLIAELSASLTAEEKLAALSENRSYSDIPWREEYERQLFLAEQTESVRREILDKIPENPIDLYPLARRLSRHFILHIGPTNSGKTHDSLEAFRNAKSGVYLAPLRLMANEIYDQTNLLGIPCNMETGEEHIEIPFARHSARTIELMDPLEEVETAVIDEAQMLEDTERGGNWTGAILGVPARNIHVCMAPYAEDLVKKLIMMCKDTFETVYHERQTPLLPDPEPFIFPKDVRAGDALIVFSKRSVMYVASELRLRGISCSVIYGALPYDVRTNEVDRFASGKTDVVVATDAIGMGLNLPIRRIVFLETIKFDGTEKRDLHPSEVQQIAGRAGRYGLFEAGTYTAEFDPEGLRKSYETFVSPLETCYLRFPKTLLSIPSPVSVLLEQWASMEDDELFHKSDMKEEIALAKELEEFSDDKELIYDFAMIPFDTEDPHLHDVWLELFAIAISGDETYNILGYLSPRKYASMDLSALEDEHKLIGLLLYYSWKYSLPETSEKLLRRKKEVADHMIRHLSEQNYGQRLCPVCRRSLPWNWPYRVCDDCFKRRRRSFSR